MTQDQAAGACGQQDSPDALHNLSKIACGQRPADLAVHESGYLAGEQCCHLLTSIGTTLMAHQHCLNGGTAIQQVDVVGIRVQL